MVNENLVNLINKKPVELVQELKDYEIKTSKLSPAARAKVIKKWGGNYVSENKGDYGPGKDGSFDCSFDQDGLNCSLGAKLWASEEGRTKKWVFKSSAEGKVNSNDGARIEASKSINYLEGDNGDEEYSMFGASIGGSLDASGPNLNAGVNLYSFKDKDKQISIRPNIDTGIISDNGCHGVKLGGFGVSVGKYSGISTPLGEVKFNTEDCVIQ